MRFPYLTLSQLRPYKWLWGFALVLAVLCFGLIAMEWRNYDAGGIWLRDFEVYRTAGQRVTEGKILFRPGEDGFYHYKYSPTAALLFIPFSLVPVEVAAVLYWLLVSTLVLAGFYLSLLIIRPGFRSGEHRHTALLLAAATAVLGVHIWAELTLGQVNQMLLVMYLAVAWLFIRRKPVALAGIWSLSLFIKPFALVFLPYFVWQRRFREIGYMASFTAFFFLLPALFYGGGFWKVQSHWLGVMASELGKKGDLFQPGNHTLASVIARFSGLESLGLGAGYLRLYYGIVLVAIALLAAVVLLKGRNISGRQGGPAGPPEALDFAFILALTPLLVYTSGNFFIMATLAVFLLLVRFRELKAWEKSLAATGCALIGINLYNQLPYEWGVELFIYLDSISLLSIGTMMLLACIASVRWGLRG